MNSYMGFVSPDTGNATAVCTELVLDVSPSMLEEDYLPSRLRAAICAAQKLIDEKAKRHPEDLVGIVCFGGWARRIHQPRPVGQYRVSLFNAAADLPTISATNIAAGLITAKHDLDSVAGGRSLASNIPFLESIFGSSQNSTASTTGRVGHVVCLSDGGWNDGDDPNPIASELKARGVVIDCIGIGGSPADVNEDLMRKIASTDRQGNPRYRFIGDTTALIQEFQKLAGHIRVLGQ